jgi:hypothetical protein
MMRENQDRAEEELERARDRLDRPEGAELHRREEERLTALLRRSDGLDNAFWTVFEDMTRKSEQTRAEILEVLTELRQEAGEAFDRYRREVGLPGPGVRGI